MDIRYIDLSEVSKEIYTAIWEITNIIDIQISTLIKFSLNHESVIFNGKSQADILHLISSDLIDVIRTYENGSPVPENRVGYYIESPNVHNFNLFCDKNVIKMIVYATREYCFKYGIETFWNGRNDIFLNIDGKRKKFIGMGYEIINGWYINSFGITYSFNSVLANKVRDLDYKNVLKTPKFDADTGDISDVVCGLLDVYPNIDPIEFDNGILKHLMKKLGSKLKKDNLSNEEMQLLINRGKKRLEDEDWMLKGNNENFI